MPESEEFEWNGEPRTTDALATDVTELAGGHFIVWNSGRAHEVFRSNGKLGDGVSLDQIELRVISDRERLVRERFSAAGGAAAQKASGIVTVKAPMPGMVRSIRAAEGDHIEKGVTLIVLEAMKMENNILAPAKGVLRKVMAREGVSVEKNMVLCEIESH